MDVLTAELTEAGVTRLAEVLALKVSAGDCIALHGDLGAGKTTFARAFIRSALGDADAEVPSPTFSIEQTYETARFLIAHYDLYRLEGAAALEEIGFNERVSVAVTLIEWPERADGELPGERIDVWLGHAARPDFRSVRIDVVGAARGRVARAMAMLRFLDGVVGWEQASVQFLAGDASARAYARLTDVVAPGAATPARTCILMDAPRQPNGPPIRDGKSYSQIAHLAEDVRPYVAVQAALLDAGLAAPRLLAHDLDAGLLLVEDLGALSFGRALEQGYAQAELWQGAVDVLLGLRQRPWPKGLSLPDGTTHRLPRFDRAALEIELELIVDWYWPSVKGAAAPEAARGALRALWSPVLDRMLVAQPGVFLRDFHSPNLFWRPARTGTDRVGLIDFQDALAEPWAYDLASLLQDARVDVPADLEAQAMARYCAEVGRREPDFDARLFAAEYAAFGAQRNTRLVGLWVRLLMRDGKPKYMQHMARSWDYLRRNLAHPDLAELRGWYVEHFPQEFLSARVGA